MTDIVIAFVVGILLGGIAVMSFYHNEFCKMQREVDETMNKYDEMKERIDNCLSRTNTILDFVDNNNT